MNYLYIMILLLFTGCSTKYTIETFNSTPVQVLYLNHNFTKPEWSNINIKEKDFLSASVKISTTHNFLKNKERSLFKAKKILIFEIEDRINNMQDSLSEELNINISIFNGAIDNIFLTSFSENNIIDIYLDNKYFYAWVAINNKIISNILYETAITNMLNKGIYIDLEDKERLKYLIERFL